MPTETRVYQDGAQVVRGQSGTQESRVYQGGAEIIRGGNLAEIRVYHDGAEIVRGGNAPETRVYQIGVEIVYREHAIELSAIPTGADVFAFSIANAISIPEIASGEVVFAFSIGRTMRVPAIEPSGEAFYPPVYIIPRNALVIQEIPSGENVFAPAFQTRITLPAIASGEQFYLPLYIIPGHSLLVFEIPSGESLAQFQLLHKEPPRTLRLRATNMQYGSPGILIVSLVDENPSNYINAEALGGVPQHGPAQTIGGLPGSTKLALLDSVSLRDQDASELAYYAAVSGFNTAWRGAIISKSGDGGATFDDITAIFTETVVGYARTVLAAPRDPSSYDTVNTLDVLLLKPAIYQLNSDTELAVLNGANAGALITSDRRVEIFQWIDATFLGNGVYRLSTLLRGRKGSEYACSGHAVGDLLVLLDPAKMERIDASISEIGLQRIFKATSIGTAIAAAIPVAFVNTGANLKPLSLVHIASARDGSNNLTVIAIPRTRLGGEWLDGGESPTGETIQSYEMDVLNGSNVVRTIATSSPSFPYSAAQQTTDFGSPQASINVVLYQLSATVGRGFPSAATV
jgi:hypothetical protein